MLHIIIAFPSVSIMSEKDPMIELQALSSKRSSLRDKLKKRREAIGSILAQATSSAEPNPPVSTSQTTTSSIAEPTPVDKPKDDKTIETEKEKTPLEGSRKRCTSTSDSKTPTQGSKKSKSESDDLMSLLSAQSAKEKADQKQSDSKTPTQGS